MSTHACVITEPEPATVIFQSLALNIAHHAQRVVAAPDTQPGHLAAAVIAIRGSLSLLETALGLDEEPDQHTSPVEELAENQAAYL